MPEPDHARPAPASPDRVDLVVVGLGITGAGVALDAVEPRAVACWRSTRTTSPSAPRAGPRSWCTAACATSPSGQVGVAHESAVERGILMEVTAPHLTRPMPMLVPLSVQRRPGAQAAVTRGGLLRRRPAAPRRPHRRRDAAAAARHLPRPRRCGWPPRCGAAGLRGGMLGWDGQLEDDARLVTTVARTAAAYGAHVRTRARVLRGDRHARRAARRAHRRDPHRDRPRRRQRRPACGPATSSTTSGCAPAAAPTWCSAGAACPG